MENFLDRQIDILLSVLLMGFLIFLIKVLAGTFGYTYQTLKRKRQRAIYPICSPTFPITKMKIGDCITLCGVDGMRYQAKRGGKYYFECTTDQTINGESYLWIDKEAILRDASKLYGKDVVKWEKY